jgi:protein translocase SecG subunit
VTLAVLLIILVLLQQSGGSSGAALGSGDNFSSAFHTRRGIEKGIFIATIVVAVLFVLSAIAVLVL